VVSAAYSHYPQPGKADSHTPNQLFRSFLYLWSLSSPSNRTHEYPQSTPYFDHKLCSVITSGMLRIINSNRDREALVRSFYPPNIMPETSPPPSPRRFSPTVVETTVKKTRQFAVEPVETTARCSKKKENVQLEDLSVEKKDAAPKRCFLPEPLETTFKNCKGQTINPLPTPEPTPISIPRSPPPAETPKPRRKFTPELIETTKRSKRAGDSRPATLPTDKVIAVETFLFICC